MNVVHSLRTRFFNPITKIRHGPKQKDYYKKHFSTSIDTKHPKYRLQDAFLNMNRVHHVEKMRLIRRWVLAGLVSTAGVAITALNNLGYSQKALNHLTPESLVEDSMDNVINLLCHVTEICTHNHFTSENIARSPAFHTLLNAIDYDDSFIKFLAIKSLAGLCENSQSMRHLLAKTIDLQILGGAILSKQTSQDFSNPQRLPPSLEDLQNIGTLYYSSIDRCYQDRTASDLNKLLLIAFNHLVSLLSQDEVTHFTILALDNSNYLNHVVQLLHNPDSRIRRTAVIAISGLTRSLAGRQALSTTNAFKGLYDLVYGPDAQTSYTQPDVSRYAKFALQQMLLSESSMAILQTKYADLMLKEMPFKVKKELLMLFDFEEQIHYDYAKQIGRSLGTGICSGLVWGALRSLLTLTPSVQPGSYRIIFSPWKSISTRSLDSATGGILLITLYHGWKVIQEKKISHERDAILLYLGQLTLGTLVGTIGVGLALREFPYSLVPALIGININNILDIIQVAKNSKRKFKNIDISQANYPVQS